MTKKTITTEEAKGKTLKKEYQCGGAKRQEILFFQPSLIRKSENKSVSS